MLVVKKLYELDAPLRICVSNHAVHYLVPYTAGNTNLQIMQHFLNIRLNFLTTQNKYKF